MTASIRMLALNVSSTTLRMFNSAAMQTAAVDAEKDLEDRLAYADSFTARPPTKPDPRNKKKAKTHVPREKAVEQLEGYFRPDPQLADLPDEGLHYDRIQVTLEGNVSNFKGKVDLAHNFLDNYCRKVLEDAGGAGAAIKMYKLQYYDEVSRQCTRCKVAAVLELRDGATLPQYDGKLSRLVGVGEGASLTDARKAAKIDLAERLVRCMTSPRDLMPGGTAKGRSLIEEYFVRIGLGEDARRTLKGALSYLEGLDSFALANDPAVAKDQARPAVRFEPKSLAKLVLDKVPCPSRLDGHPLPVCKEFKRVLGTILDNQVTIVSAATGSGKTTQIPQFILEAYAGTSGERPSVIVTQPRRIAAKSVAKRVAEERRERLGQSIGYSVRFDSVPAYGRDGTVMFCTSGILLKKLQSDPNLTRMTHLILDEVHERDVNTDLILMVVKTLLRSRPDLKVILMSATMQVGHITEYFREFTVGCALDLEGTNYPIKEHHMEDVLHTLAGTKSGYYLKRIQEISQECKDYAEKEVTMAQQGLIAPPPVSSNVQDVLMIQEQELKPVPYEIVAALISYIHAEKDTGAILCFLPGWEEMSAVNKILLGLGGTNRMALHLVHSTIPQNSADEIFAPPPPGKRKIILATNIAESSITIPDVVYVIDSGKQKIMHYDQRHRMNILESCWISKANLRQRLGRAGRCKPGEYYSLMSKARAGCLAEQTPPEILRLGLEEVCLGLKAMNMKGSCQSILRTAIDPPDQQAIKQSVTRLIELGAMNADESLTPLGRFLANIPVHPALGRMLVLAVIFKCVDPILTVVASVGERLFKPARLPEEKVALHGLFAKFHQTQHSDHLLAHSVYQTWISETGMQRLGYHGHHPVSNVAMKRMTDLRRNLEKTLIQSLGANLSTSDWNANSGNEALMRMIISTGFYPDVAVFKDKRNSFQLRKLRDVKVAGTSSVYELSTSRPSLKRTQRPHYYVYEELMDIGQKIIIKLTAVDPLLMSLMAGKTDLKQVEGKLGMAVDDWLAIQPESSQDLSLINEMRMQFGRYLQWALDKRINGRALTAQEEEAQELFEKAIMAFLSQSTIYRERRSCA